MHRQREEVRTWCKLLSFTDAVISPATDSMITLCQCVGELPVLVNCVSELAVSVRKGCAQTSGGCMQTTFRKCADNVQGIDSEGHAENVRLRLSGRGCKDLLIGREPKIRKNTQGKEQKITVIERLIVSNSTILNQELNSGSTDWNKEAELIKSLF